MKDRMEVMTPLGAMWVRMRGTRCVALDFERPDAGARSPIPAGVASAIETYFAGDHAALDAIPIAPEGSAFQLRVWAALREIPPGATRSYGELAARLGAGSARAVGRASGSNRIALAIPCHRLIGADGSLTGYAGGLARKAWLLAHEGGRGTIGEMQSPQRRLALP